MTRRIKRKKEGEEMDGAFALVMRPCCLSRWIHSEIQREEEKKKRRAEATNTRESDDDMLICFSFSFIIWDWLDRHHHNAGDGCCQKLKTVHHL
jgi:hypothetical protein